MNFKVSQVGRFILISCLALVSGREALWASDDQLIAGAKKEGEVSLYLSTNLTDANGMMQSFKQKYPFVNVGLFRADNEKLLSRILTEASAGKFSADVVLISSFEVRVLIQKKLLQKYLSPRADFIQKGSPIRTVTGRASIRFRESWHTTPSWCDLTRYPKPTRIFCSPDGKTTWDCPTAPFSGMPAF